MSFEDRRIIGIWLATTAAAALLFTAFPDIDIMISSLFWSPSAGWRIGSWPPFEAIFEIIPILTWGLVLALLCVLAAINLFERPFGPFDRDKATYLLFNLILGPGLVANVLLKDHWGRARPSQIMEFGGTAQFTSALEPSNQCLSNCSFVSGHASMAFALIGFAFVIEDETRRRQAIQGILGFGALVGLVRIAQGGHFLSDTVFAALFMLAIAWSLHRWIVVDNGLEGPVLRTTAHAIGTAAIWISRQWQDLAISPARRWQLFHIGTVLAILVSFACFDRQVATQFNSGDDRLDHLLRWITQFGEGKGWIAFGLIGGVLCLAVARAPRFAPDRERWLAWSAIPSFIGITALLSGAVADILKVLIGRSRPKLLFSKGIETWGGGFWHSTHWQSDYWSFPSGHCTTIAAVAMAAYMLWPRHVLGWCLLAGMVILSRIGLDQHYASDTIAGTWLGIMTTVYLRGVLARSGYRLEDLRRGVLVPVAPTGWSWRLLGLETWPRWSRRSL